MKKRFTFLVSSLFPSMFARMAYKKLTHPRVHKLREHELTTLAKANHDFLDYEGFRIKTYAWNQSGSKAAILLVHGWEGQAGNFCDLVEELVKADYRIYSFDGPSHGFSSKGAASLFEFIQMVNLLIQKWEVRNVIHLLARQAILRIPSE